MKNRISVKTKGSFVAYIDFPKKYVFDLGDGYKLTVPDNNDRGIKKYFKLSGKVKPKVANSEEMQLRVNRFINWLSFWFNVPCAFFESDQIYESLNFGLIEIGTTKKEGRSNIQAKAAISKKIQEAYVNAFKQVINIKINKDRLFILELFRKCHSKNLYYSFWHIYNIFQILIGDRKSIDDHAKTFSEIKQVHHDPYSNHPYGEDISILTAIRDLFSHKDATFSEQKLDIDKELKDNIADFRKVARKTIADKLNFKNLLPV